MSILSDSLVLSLESIQGNAGRLCFDNFVNSSNISATSELTAFPASNMANEATAFGWEATDTTTQTVTILNPTAAGVDYIGMARHNLNQSGLTLTVKFDGAVVVSPVAVSSAQAQLILFQQARPSVIELIIEGASNAPKIAVVYAGLSLKLERNIYVGHTPITYGRDRNTINGVSQSGEWLGEVVLGETLSTDVTLNDLTPLWYRSNLDPYFQQSPRKPCFWAWRPETYPLELGYCWVEGNPRPVNARSNGLVNISWKFRGIA
jgi:hypothetical protein